MDPKFSYRFFPAQEPWTWEQEEEYVNKKASGGAGEPGGPGVGLEWVPSGEGQQLTQSGMGQDIVSEAMGHGTVRQCRLEEIPSSTHGGRAHHPPDNTE